MKEIKLTRGYTALVDDEDFEYLNQWKWHVSVEKGGTYAVRSDQSKNGNRKRIAMHRVIMNTPLNLQVDHIDHNGLNNQRSNLRNCSLAENRRNVNRHGTTEYLGVFIDKNNFRAIIRHNKERYHIGNFKTAEEAAMAYDRMAIKLHGEFANLNFKTKE